MAHDTILIIEDDRKTAETVRLYLEAADFEVVVAADGSAGLRAARRVAPALVVLDLMLPGLDGETLCSVLRRETGVPIVMLTARTTERDRLAGFALGADDYVSKPFSPRELVARVQAVLRRARNTAEDAPPVALCVGDLELDEARARVTRAGRPVAVTPTERRLLAVLMAAPGRVFGRGELIERALDPDYEGLERTVDAHIGNLRRKLRVRPGRPGRIETVFGSGYRLAPGEAP